MCVFSSGNIFKNCSKANQGTTGCPLMSILLLSLPFTVMCYVSNGFILLVKAVLEGFDFPVKNLLILFFPPLVNCSPTGIVPCPATPTTFGHIRTANGQGQQRRRITSIQPPTGLQEWLRTFQVSMVDFSVCLLVALPVPSLYFPLVSDAKTSNKASSKSRCCAQSMFTSSQR